MKPAPFEYHAPTTVDGAVGLLESLGDGARALAGGQSLIPLMALRLSYFDHLVDLCRIEELRSIERVDGQVRIGATARQAEVGTSAVVAAGVPLLARCTPLIGHFQIRNRGTLGGSIAHADPAGEYPAVALALDAVMEIRSPAGDREVPAKDFFRFTWMTCLDEGDLLTAVRFPVWSGRCGFAVEEIARRHGDFAIAGAVVGVEVGPDDIVRRAAIGLMGVGPTPQRGTAAEIAAVGTSIDDLDPVQLGRRAVADLESVPADTHGSADYRRHVAAVAVSSAWTRAVEEADRA